jgi:hypothetical protein
MLRGHRRWLHLTTCPAKGVKHVYELIVALAAVSTPVAAWLALILWRYNRRQHSLEQRQLEAFYEVGRYSWGMTGNISHPLYRDVNMRAVEALNAAYVVFVKTDAEEDLKEYRRRPTAVNAENAVMSMGEVCGIILTPDDLSPFGPGGSSSMSNSNASPD